MTSISTNPPDPRAIAHIKELRALPAEDRIQHIAEICCELGVEVTEDEVNQFFYDIFVYPN